MNCGAGAVEAGDAYIYEIACNSGNDGKNENPIFYELKNFHAFLFFQKRKITAFILKKPRLALNFFVGRSLHHPFSVHGRSFDRGMKFDLYQ